MSAITSRPPGFSTRRASRERGGRIRQMVQHQQQRRGVELAVGDRQRLELAAPDLDVREIAQRAARRLQHLPRSVDRDHARDKRRERARDLPGAAAEIADCPALVQQRRAAPGDGSSAEQIRAQLVPLPRRGLEELLGLRLAAGQHVLSRRAS